MRGGKVHFQERTYSVCYFLRFMETFKSRYPVLRTFLHRCVAQARTSRCVETMSGRYGGKSDYLPTKSKGFVKILASSFVHSSVDPKGILCASFCSSIYFL